MTLSAGARLGPYEIVASIGAGGMGEVYRARDTRLDRTVAVKVLPSHLSASPESRQRFEREARTISQLSHPHICALYDVGREGETEYLVMEYLEGETLTDRLLKGAFPLEQTLKYGIEIADALDKAHRQSVVHRDLKPGNVMVTKSGVKLLDFGLAKALAAPTASPELTAFPTQAAVTREGTILGTVQYMSPEQLQGIEADARTDVFALGAVLYEMATGRKAFVGANQASLIGAILRDDPQPISEIQPVAPRGLDRVVRTCLAKDPEDRWQTARDVALQLGWIERDRTAETPSPRSVEIAAGAKPRRASRLPWIVAAASAAIATAALLRSPKPAGSAASAIRFTVPPPPTLRFASSVEFSFIAISPDGSQLAFVTRDPEGLQRIIVRPLSSLQTREVPGTEGATSIFYSPDGRSIGFFAGDKLKRVEVSGGAPVTICDVPAGVGHAGSWGRGDDVLFAPVQGEAIYRVPAAGGTPARLTHPDRARGEARTVWPTYLSDGERFLYLLLHSDGRGALMLAEPDRKPRVVGPMHSVVRYVEPGYLVFAREGTLLAQRFDEKSGRLTGEPFSVGDRVRYHLSSGSAFFEASRSGTLAWQSEEDRHHLAWFDRGGNGLETIGAPGFYQRVEISPDGRRVLYDRKRPGIGTLDIWTFDLDRATETPITSHADTEAFPLWLDGATVAYSRVRGTPPQLVRQHLATGKEEDLLPAGKMQGPHDVTPDGRTLLYGERGEEGVFRLGTVPLSGGKVVPFLPTASISGAARFSRDGKFVALISVETGGPELYVTAYPGPGEKIRVSAGGARHPRWTRDGRELLYLSGDRRLMAVPVRTSPSLELGKPVPLFTTEGKGWNHFDVSPDGKRFLAVVREVVADELPLTVVTNWAAELRKE